MIGEDEFIKKIAKKRKSPYAVIQISGENTTTAKAAEKLGMKLRSFTEKRRNLVNNLPPGQSITWEHFNGKG